MRQHAAATERNREPILSVLRSIVPEGALVLEIASGTGQHAAFFASSLPGVVWQPSDPDPTARASIASWCDGIPNVRAPLDLDVTRQPWPIDRADAIVVINMIHIAPWSACEALMQGAGEALASGDVLYMYGPYKRDGRHTAPSNDAFDRRLRESDAAWGVRDLDEVVELASSNGLELERVVEMPANNLSVVYRRG